MDKISELEAARKKRELQAQEKERQEVDKMMKNPLIHGLGNLVYAVKLDGAMVDVYQKPLPDSPPNEWKHLGEYSLSKMTYDVLLQASILEQKIFMLRDKYEPESMRGDVPPSFGLPTGVKDGKPSGFTEYYPPKDE